MLFAQHASAAHLIEHHSARTSQSQDFHEQDEDSCEQCFVFAHLSGATVTSHVTAIFADFTFHFVVYSAVAVLASRQITRRNRGPPVVS